MTSIQPQPISRSLAVNRPQGGFSILEFLVAIAVLTIIMGALLTFMGNMQERYSGEQKVAAINQGGKTGMDLLATDIGQAGYPAGVNATTSQAVITPGSLTLNLSNTIGMYVGRVVVVGFGSASQESVTVTACTSTVTSTAGCTAGASDSITGLFKKTHASGVPVTATAMPYPQGVIFNTAHFSDPTKSSSDCNSLKIMGDLRGDGSLRYVEYRYTPPPSPTSDTPGVLVRSDTSAFVCPESTPVTVVDNLRDPSIFNYKVNAANCSGLPACVTCVTEGSSFTYVTQVGVTMTMRTAAAVERGAGGTRTIVFKQQYFTPRNVVYAINLAKDGLQTVLPLAPGNVNICLAP